MMTENNERAPPTLRDLLEYICLEGDVTRDMLGTLDDKIHKLIALGEHPPAISRMEHPRRDFRTVATTGSNKFPEPTARQLMEYVAADSDVMRDMIGTLEHKVDALISAFKERQAAAPASAARPSPARHQGQDRNLT